MIVHRITSEVIGPSMYSDMELEVIRTHRKSLPVLQKGITSLSGINTFDAGFDTNIYKVDEWEKLKSAGAVFLPAAGHRNASGLYDVGSTGYYWHSSPREDAADYAYLLYFKGFSLYDSHILKRELGHCVRLVTDSVQSNAIATPMPSAILNIF